MTTIGIIENDTRLRTNLEKLFQIDGNYKVLFSLLSLEHLLTNSDLQKEPPYVLFLDIGLPGISGLKGMVTIQKIFPTTNIILITGQNNDEMIWQGLSGGAKGYLIKPVSFDTIKEQIKSLQDGGAYLSADVARILINKVNTVNDSKVKSQYFEKLSPKENEVVQQIIKGLTYKEVGVALNISYTTVNDHLKNIYKKLSVNSKAELISKVLNN